MHIKAKYKLFLKLSAVVAIAASVGSSISMDKWDLTICQENTSSRSDLIYQTHPWEALPP